MSLRRVWWICFVASVACETGSQPASHAAPTADYSEPIVLLVSPDSAEIERLKGELGEDFGVTADDAMWYRAAAYALLDSLQIRHAEVTRGAARFLVAGKPTLVSWDNAEQAWFAIIYNGRDTPTLVPDIDLRAAVAPGS
jgi:hypothetical protein